MDTLMNETSTSKVQKKAQCRIHNLTQDGATYIDGQHLWKTP